MGFIHLMKPLSRFFRSQPTPPTLATQVAVLDAAAPAELGATATGDGAEALRIAAIRKLTDAEILRGLAGLRERADPGSPTLERAAQERLAQFDLVVTCTASTLPIIGKGTLERVVRQRRHRPVFIATSKDAFSGAEDEARNADRIAQQTEELESLIKQRDTLRTSRAK